MFGGAGALFCNLTHFCKETRRRATTTRSHARVRASMEDPVVADLVHARDPVGARAEILRRLRDTVEANWSWMLGDALRTIVLCKDVDLNPFESLMIDMCTPKAFGNTVNVFARLAPEGPMDVVMCRLVFDPASENTEALLRVVAVMHARVGFDPLASAKLRLPLLLFAGYQGILNVNDPRSMCVLAWLASVSDYADLQNIFLCMLTNVFYMAQMKNAAADDPITIGMGSVELNKKMKELSRHTSLRALWIITSHYCSKGGSQNLKYHEVDLGLNFVHYLDSGPTHIPNSDTWTTARNRSALVEAWNSVHEIIVGANSTFSILKTIQLQQDGDGAVRHGIARALTEMKCARARADNSAWLEMMRETP